MGKTELLKILLANMEGSGFGKSRSGGRIITAVKDRQFCYGVAGTLDSENLFAAVGRNPEILT
jgi:hypothetical protein